MSKIRFSIVSVVCVFVLALVLSPKVTAADTTVKVYFHVVHNDGNYSYWDHPSDLMIKAQIGALNQAFSGTGFTFALALVDRTQLDTVKLVRFNQVEKYIKTLLRRGSAADLNLYTAALEGLGWGTFPWDYTSLPKIDGVVVNYKTMPGANYVGDEVSLGYTAVQEVGHWLGLYDTFQGGCTAPGDFVDDTPPQKARAYRCPIGLDSCPGGGPDPIHNFMAGYTDETCRSQFTPGQAARMRTMWDTFRRGK